MTKKELEKQIDGLREELGEFRYKAGKYDEVAEEVKRLEKALNRCEGKTDLEIAFLRDRVRQLILRNDILTMTPEQIETMRKVKVRGRMDEPLDLPNRRSF